MTGGAGFSTDSTNRLKGNHKLGKIREKSTFSSGNNDPDYRKKATSKSLHEGIEHRFKRKKEIQKITWISFTIVALIVLVLILFS